MEEKILATGDVTKVTLHRLLRSMCVYCFFFFLISYLQSALLLAGQPKKNKNVRLKRLLKHLKKRQYYSLLKQRQDTVVTNFYETPGIMTDAIL